MEELENLALYLKHTTIETIKTKVTATLFKSHPLFTRKEDIVVELRAHIL